MPNRRSALSVLALAVAMSATASPAVAAPKDGAYKGTSSGRIDVRMPDPVLGVKFVKQTDKGKVSFSVKRGVIKAFSLTGQKAMCGGQPLDVKIKLSSLRMGIGGGKGIYTDPNLGPQTVTVKLGSNGKATGTIKYGGLCATATATFSAKIG